MAQNNVCPTLQNILAANECLENLAGLGSVVYVGIKGDLAQPMTATENEYSTPVFKSGKGLYRFDCKDESQKVASSSLGYRQGFAITGTIVLDAVNKLISKTGRALNNLDLFYIFPDGDENQILYDPYRKVKIDNDGMTSDTGAAAADDRQTTINVKLQPSKYMHLYVTPPQTGGWDSLLADAGSSD